MSDKRVDPVETSGNMEDRFSPPGDLTALHVPTVGVVATITGAAGVGGQKNVVTGFCFNVASANLITAATIGAAIIDGVTGGTGYLFRTVLTLTSTGLSGGPFSMSGLSLVGSANTAVTIEFSGAVAGAFETVNLFYHRLAGAGS